VTAARRYRPGDQVALATAPDQPVGEVVGVEQLGDRQILRVQDTDGSCRAIAVDLSADGSVISGPVDLSQAQDVARQVLSGRAVRLPESQQVTALAAALLVLTPTHWRSSP